MDTYGKIAEKIRAIAKKGKISEVLILPAQVKSVSGTTCTVNIDDLEVTDVRLRAVINSETEQLLIKPKVGSYVLIADLSGGSFTDFAVLSYSEAESVSIKIGSQTINIDKNGIVCNDGQNGGSVNINSLVGWMQNVHADMLAIATGLASVPYTFVPTTQAPVKTQLEDVRLKH